MPLYNRRGRRSIRQALFFGIACFSLAREPFDKIDCCGFPFFSLVVCAAIAKLRRKRIVSTWLEVWGRAYWTEYLGGLGVLGALVERVCAQLPDRFVSISELTTSRLVEILHVPRKRIATIPIGVDLGSIDREPFDPIRSDVLYVGRLMAFKNVDVVIRAIARLRDEGLTLRFRIIGDGPEMPRLRSLTAALGVAETVRFEGFIADHPYACMKSTRMLVVPSQREGFGIVAVEAMACGVPVVTVDEPENATRFLVSPDTGIVTEATVGALATAFRSIAESDRDWQLSCRAHAERYEWSRIARDVATEYAADS